MVEIGVGACEEHASLQSLRTDTQPDLDACKRLCAAAEDCSFISYKSPESSCALFKGILCALDPAHSSAVTYGKPEWLHDHWPYYPARCELGEDSTTFKLFDTYDCAAFHRTGGTLPFNGRYSCEELVGYSDARYSYEGCGPTGMEEGCPKGTAGDDTIYPGGREYTKEDLKALLQHCPNACRVCPPIAMGKGCKRSSDCGTDLLCILSYDHTNVHRPMCLTVDQCQASNGAAGHPDAPCDTVEARQATATSL
jgi:hypothetical protein